VLAGARSALLDDHLRRPKRITSCGTVPYGARSTLLRIRYNIGLPTDLLLLWVVVFSLLTFSSSSRSEAQLSAPKTTELYEQYATYTLGAPPLERYLSSVSEKFPYREIDRLSTGHDRAMVWAQNMDPKSLCASKLTAFIAELDELLGVTNSSEPINEAIKRSFPLYGCDIDGVLTISQRSRYFDRFEKHEKYVVVIFQRRNSHGSGIKVSFGLTIPAGNSESPAAMVRKPGEL